MVNATDLEISKTQRRTTKASITREFNKLDGAFADDADVDAVAIQSSIDKLESNFAKVNDFSDKIVRLIDASAVDDEVQKATDFSDYYFDRIGPIKNNLKKFQAGSSANGLPTASAADHLNSSGFSDRQVSVKLPKINIAKFDGDASRWQEFWDSFESTIHENAELSAVDKFKYLKSFLGKDPAVLTDGYRLTAANYETVVDCLKQRYGNTEAAIFQHFEKLLAIPPSGNDFKSLQSVYDECERHIRSLVALGLDESMFGLVFTPIILSKLPKFVRIDLHRQNGLVSWTLPNLRKLLTTEIQVREMSQHSFGSINAGKEHVQSNGARRFGNGKFRSEFKGTASNLVSHGTAKQTCVFCGDGHDAEFCKKHPDNTSRRNAIKGRCFICFRDNHMSPTCRIRQNCKHCTSLWHHSSLCPKKFPSQTTTARGKNDSPSGGKALNANAPQFVSHTTVSHTVAAPSKGTHMQTALANIRKFRDPGSLQARAIFDTASSKSYVTTDLCKRLGLPTVGRNTLSVAAFRARKLQNDTCDLVQLHVECVDGTMRVVDAFVIEHICEPVGIYPVDFEKYPNLSGLGFAETLVTEPTLGGIDIMFGGDSYFKFITGFEEFEDGFVLLQSRLGCVLGGIATWNGGASFDSSLVCAMLCPDTGQPDPNFALEKFWGLEEIGVSDKADQDDHDMVLDDFNKSVKFDGTRYSVRWPWKVDHPELPSNFGIAFGRLKSLVRKLNESGSSLADLYTGTIAQQEENQIIERVDGSPGTGIVHYIPHHAVVKPDRATTKLRVVFDASAKADKASPSLNECLHRGPVILSDLVGLLLRFRLNPIAVAADLEKAFLQVELQDDQRDCARFLWVKNLEKPVSMDNLIVYRFRRVLFGVISSPFLLAATVSYHLRKVKSPVSKKIADNVYVDNVITSLESTDAARSFYHSAKSIFSTAAMNLREWYTNDPTLRSDINQKDRGESSTPKVLGLVWELSGDQLKCPSMKTKAPACWTKRSALQSVASCYDPLGLFSPVTVVGKCLMQELWQQKYDWDISLPGDLQAQWNEFYTDLSQVSLSSVPRYVSLPGKPSLELHCFCDASAKAYSAVVYLVARREEQTTSNIVFAKSRVCPVKRLSIPRLELLAVYMGSKMTRFVEQQLRVSTSGKYVWTDSTCILHWVKNDKWPSRFIANRVKSIRCGCPLQFCYVPTAENPADIGSRGCNAGVLGGSPTWWHGPNWIVTPNRWPVQDESYQAGTVEPDQETSGPPEVQLQVQSRDKPTEFLFDMGTVSSLPKLLRVTAWVFRACSRFKGQPTPQNGPSVSELRVALTYWIKAVQKAEFVMDGTGNSEMQKLKRNLQVFEADDRLLHCQGRLDFAGVPETAKRPVLLPRNHRLSDLVIMDCHRRLCHSGVSQTVSEVRQVYWIPKIRVQVKHVLNDCPVCKRVVGKPLRAPDPPHLPPSRVQRQDPFATTGLDYIGPLFVRTDNGSQKVWLCLFTCAVIRAIHLEVVLDLSSEQFLLCLRRFIAIYGKPDKIISDNASQFRASHRALVRLIQENDEIVGFSATNGIEWQYIPEFSPWMGGFYERLVADVKKGLLKVLWKTTITVIELQTIVAEISAVVNARPLTYLVSTDCGDVSLTPAHFLQKHARPTMSMLDCAQEQSWEPGASTAGNLAKLWRKSQAIFNNFWNRWHREYLQSLMERSRSKRSPGASSHPLHEGTVVLVKDNLPRGQWRMGLITSLRKSADDKVRSAVVKLANNRQIVRPLKLLIPLETEVSGPEKTATEQPAVQVGPNSRPQRQAAIVSRQKTKAALAAVSDSDE